MSRSRRRRPRSRAAWPVLALLAFLCLAATPVLPAGYLRAVVAAPVLLIVPGALTLGAAIREERLPRGIVFISLALLLGAIWSVFVSLLLYALGILITASSTYIGLLTISAALAIVAQARLWLAAPGAGHRTPRFADSGSLDAHQPEKAHSESQSPWRISAYTAGAALGGVCLLGGGLFVYDHLPHPAPVGYTAMAWTGPRVTDSIQVGPAGADLHFQIVHHQPRNDDFELSADWLGATLQPMSRPLGFRIGPDQTYHGTLFVPPLPNGCTYRIVVTLSASRQLDALTKRAETWSINADVYDPAKSRKKC